MKDLISFINESNNLAPATTDWTSFFKTHNYKYLLSYGGFNLRHEDIKDSLGTVLKDLLGIDFDKKTFTDFCKKYYAFKVTTRSKTDELTKAEVNKMFNLEQGNNYDFHIMEIKYKNFIMLYIALPNDHRFYFIIPKDDLKIKDINELENHKYNKFKK